MIVNLFRGSICDELYINKSEQYHAMDTAIDCQPPHNQSAGPVNYNTLLGLQVRKLINF